MPFELTVSVYWSRHPKKGNGANMSWIDDDDRKRKEQSRRDDTLEAKAFLFWDSVFESVKRDVATVKERYSINISALRLEPGEILIKKEMPYPTFSIRAVLDVLSKSVRVEWSRKEDRDQEITRRATRWLLSLDSSNGLHVTADGDEIEADDASKRMLRPMTV